MKLCILVVRDKAAEVFSQPMFGTNVGGPTREFLDLCKDKGHAYGKHPEHYSLYQLGFFYDDTGKFELFAEAKLLVSGDVS